MSLQNMSNSMNRGPKCPNHAVPLLRTDTPGIGICPISGCEFEYEAVDQDTDKKEEFEMVMENGNMVKRLKTSYKILKNGEDD